MFPSQISEKVSVSQERVSGLPEKGADLWGSPGTSGEVLGTSGEVSETSGEPLGAGRFHSERIPGKLPKNFQATSGEVRGLPRSSGEPDSLPATRQISLQKILNESQGRKCAINKFWKKTGGAVRVRV